MSTSPESPRPCAVAPPMPAASAPAAGPGFVARTASVAVCVLASSAIWLVFYPGLLSPDSIDQYSQALRGRFHDWHPPIMAIALSGVFALGGHVAAVMLAQSIAGLLGVQALAAELLALSTAGRLGPVARGWVATGLALLLLLPLSPLAFYLMTFWKDAWFAILLLWTGALSVRLYRVAAHRRLGGDLLRLLLLLVLAGLAPLLRHNALVVLPIFCLLCGLAAARRFGRLAGAAALGPLLVFFVAERGLYRWFPIDRTHPENQIKALELVGVCVLNPAAQGDLPYTAAHLAADFDPARYRFGNVSPLLWDQPVLVRPGYVQGGPNDELGREYWLALRSHPREIVECKLRGFFSLLGLDRTNYWIQPSLIRNDHGLESLSWTAPLRTRWVTLADQIAAHHRWRWVGAVPAVWLAANGLLLAAILLYPRRPQSPYGPLASRDAAALSATAATGFAARGLHVLLLLLPLTYFASYLLATPSHDFRFMYPAILFVQVYAAAMAAALLGNGGCGVEGLPGSTTSAK